MTNYAPIDAMAHVTQEQGYLIIASEDPLSIGFVSSGISLYGIPQCKITQPFKVIATATAEEEYTQRCRLAQYTSEPVPSKPHLFDYYYKVVTD